MIKKLFLICISLFILNNSFSQGIELQSIVKKLEKSIFLVECYNNSGKLISQGSACLIDNSGVIVTNIHVVKDATKVKVKSTSNKYFNVVSTVGFLIDKDLIKLKLENFNNYAPKLQISKKRGMKGEEIFTIGNPDGLESSVSKGIISSIREIENIGVCYQISASISPGSSGGALFNLRGELLGITTFCKTDNNRLNQNLNFAVDINYLNKIPSNTNMKLLDIKSKNVFNNFTEEINSKIISNQLEDAEIICKQEIKNNPQNWIAYRYLGKIYFEKMLYNEAEINFVAAIEHNSDEELKEDDFMMLGIINRLKGEFKNSLLMYNEVLKRNPNNANCYCSLSILLYHLNGQKNVLDVSNAYKKAIEIDENSCSFAYKCMGEEFLSQEDFKNASVLFTKSIEIEPNPLNSANEYYNRGVCYTQLSFASDDATYAELAILDFKHCLITNPNDQDIYFRLGIISQHLSYIKKENNDNACIFFRKANDLNNKTSKNMDAEKRINDAINRYCN